MITMQTAWSAFMAGNGAWVPVVGKLAAMPISETAPVWLGLQNNVALLAGTLEQSKGVDFVALRRVAQESRRLRAQILGALVLSRDFSTPLKGTAIMMRAHLNSISSVMLQAVEIALKDMFVRDDDVAGFIAEETLKGGFVLLRQGEMIGEVVPTERGYPIGDSVATILKFRFNRFLSDVPLPEIEIVKGGAARLQVFPLSQSLGIEVALFNGESSGVREFSFWDDQIGDFNTGGVALRLMEWIGIPV